jgi:hypothetical protein
MEEVGRARSGDSAVANPPIGRRSVGGRAKEGQERVATAQLGIGTSHEQPWAIIPTRKPWCSVRIRRGTERQEEKMVDRGKSCARCERMSEVEGCAAGSRADGGDCAPGDRTGSLDRRLDGWQCAAALVFFSKELSYMWCVSYYISSQDPAKVR